MPTLQKNPTTSILIRVPLGLKKALQRSAKGESTTRYIIEAVEERMRREKLQSWIREYVQSDTTFTIQPVSRQWSTRRFYHFKKK